MIPVLLSVVLVPQSLSTSLSHRAIDRAPARYRVECTYNTLDVDGKVIAANKYAGTYSTDQKAGELGWSDVTKNGTPQEFMNGFSYSRPSSLRASDDPSFFKGFPATAIECRNLVWDMRMEEHFAEDYQDKLALNEPLTIDERSTVALADSGTFFTSKIDLTWLANTEWRGRKCALIRYRSFYNRLDCELGSMRVKGSSQYWGEIWVSLRSRRIEYATLYECVTVMVSKTMPVSVMREGSFERL